MNILDSVWAFYLPAICGFGVRSGILIFIFIQFYRGLPKELEDAAYIDGCGPLRTFLRIMLPNALPALITVLLFSVVWYWNDYQYAGMFLVDNQTLPLRLSNLKMVLNSAAGQQLDPYQLSVLLPGRLPAGDPAAPDSLYHFPALFHGKHRTHRPCRMTVERELPV